jgi:CelD/BcsL family acetyltransferase involved in cellulose biosynthesis
MIELILTDHFDFNSEAYRNLLRNAQITPFQYPEWLTSYYRHMVVHPGSRAMVILGHSRTTGALQLVLPLVKMSSNNKTVIEYAYSDVTDYACPVLHTDLLDHREALSTLPGKLAEVLGKHAPLHIKPVRAEESPIWECLLDQPPAMLGYGRHQVTPSLPFSSWRDQNFGKARRSQLDRKLRRLNDQGNIRLEIVPPKYAADAIGWARKHRKGRFPNDPIQRPETLRFYSEVASSEAAAAFTRTYRLLCGNDTVAVCFGIVDEIRFYYLVLACDYQQYAAYSPGTLILDLTMGDWISGGGKIFDFTIGDEAYKSDFRCDKSPMYEFISGQINQEESRE